MTFRREMEEMSKKTKRLEKENHNLTRKHELTSSNILQMAEDRQKAAKELEVLKKKNENLEKLCRGMQAQGRGGTVMQQAQQQARLVQQQQATTQAQHQHQHQQLRTTASGVLSNGASQAAATRDKAHAERFGEGTESEYEYGDEEDDLDDEGSELGGYDDDDTEDEAHALVHQAAAAGSVPPSTRVPKTLPQGQRALPTFGPTAPPPVQKPAPLVSGRTKGSGNSGHEGNVLDIHQRAGREKGKKLVMNGVKH